MHTFVQHCVFIITHKCGFDGKLYRNQKETLCNRYSVQSIEKRWEFYEKYELFDRS